MREGVRVLGFFSSYFLKNLFKVVVLENQKGMRVVKEGK